MATNLQGLEARGVWLRRALADLDKNIKVAPRLMALNLLAVPVWVVWNYRVALGVAVVATGLAFTTFYVAWIHRRECSEELEGLESELARVAATDNTRGTDARG